jgi:RNA polymerase sigma-70 factor, ECF subfamily
MSQSDDELMVRYVQGDEHAFNELFRRLAPLVARFLARRGKRSSEIHDLVQETFLHLHRGRNDFRLGDEVRPWLFTIARNLSVDHGRRLRRRPETLADMERYDAVATDACSALVAGEGSLRVKRAVAALSARDRSLVTAHFFEGSSFTELERQSGVPASTLRVRAHRACAKLRQTLGFMAHPQFGE